MLRREGQGCRRSDLWPTGNKGLIFSRFGGKITGPGKVCFLLITLYQLPCTHFCYNSVTVASLGVETRNLLVAALLSCTCPFKYIVIKLTHNCLYECFFERFIAAAWKWYEEVASMWMGYANSVLTVDWHSGYFLSTLIVLLFFYAYAVWT